MTYFTGIDVSLRSVSICIVDERGEVCHEAKTAAQPAAIAQCLRGFDADVNSVGLEAGTLTQYLTYGLQAAGFEVVCMESRQVKNTLAAMRNKTDRNDARGIAQILRTGWYSRVHVKSMHSHRVRALLASRKAILKKCVDLENELRGLLRVFGVCLASRVGHGSFDGEVRQTFAGDEMLACALNPLLDARTMLYKTYLKLDNAIKALVKADPVCKLLMSVPGVGPVTALSFKAGVDDPSRFKSSRTVAAHFGLTPRRFQSGESDNPGHISRAGDADVRSALYVAAHSLLTRNEQWSSLKAWGMRLAKTRGHRRAVIAVARKLAIILHRMWSDGTEFRWGAKEVAA
ncbi:IS110 family transposase [Variovorax sp. OV329]|uniref:IS110 family transposase n=1 Tax=Variovorax sp. OV329 TaxID=1882825 RepID=UPI0008E7AF8A|nr:IS110 family transposase [Variovorax sp. OV329]SFN01278.1 Transposase [Variovorax sp. OV329]